MTEADALELAIRLERAIEPLIDGPSTLTDRLDLLNIVMREIQAMGYVIRKENS